ncbi:hypothetical protein V3C99_012030 [Haemonchus contortus]
MRSPVVAAYFLLLSNICAQHINIEVTFNKNTDDTIVDIARVVGADIERGNSLVSTSVSVKNCDSYEDGKGCVFSNAYVNISSFGVFAGRPIVETSKAREQILQVFVEFTGRFFSSQALREDDADWWVRRPAAPHAKHLEQLAHLINDRSEHYTFVLYYKPDGYENFAAYYACSELFHSGNARGLVVDCSEEKEICEHQAVETTPALIAYSTGKAYKHYPHAMDTFLIQDWIKTIQNPVITKLSEASVPYYREGIVPGFDSPRPSVIMFFAPTRDSDTFRNYERFAHERHGDFHLAELIDQSIEKWAHHPAFVAMKPLEKLSKANTLYEGITYESMVEFVEENLHPSVHHLNSVQALLNVFSMERPAVIFFDITNSKDILPFSSLAANYAVRSKVAVFAASQGLSMSGLFLAHIIKIDATTPSYILVNSKNGSLGCVFTREITNENESELELWLRSVKDYECEHATTIDMNILVSLRNWERQENLRRLLRNKDTLDHHEEL